MPIRRRDLFGAAGAFGFTLSGAASALFGARPAEAASAPAVPKRPRILLREGYIVSLDPKIGELRGDVLIDNGKIAAVGKNLKAEGAEIVDASNRLVLPGFIDSHRHSWQGVLRHQAVDWSLFQYFGTIFTKYGTNFRPEDVYVGTLLTRLGALESGITTMVDWAHIMNTPEHADASVHAARDSGGRTVFAMGWPQTPEPLKWIQKSTLDLPNDIVRVRKQHFSSNTGLVTLQMAARGPEFAVMEQVAKDLKTARDLGLQTTAHISGGGTIVAMQKAGLLGPDITHVHLLRATNEEVQMLKDSGGTASVSPPGEEWKTPWQGDPPATARLVRNGVIPSLSIDTEAFAVGDMFSTMRGTLGSSRYAVSHPAENEGVQAPPDPRQWHPANVIPMQMILEMATVHGAKPCGLDGKVGTISPGKEADLVLLDTNNLLFYPINKAVDAVVVAADTSCVDAVFVAGKAVKYNGKLVNQAQVSRVRKLAMASRDYLLAKGGVTLPDGLRPKTV
jgi:5-methylthioadenosine/S-adenosylhomocysteine deaminase